MSSNHPRKWTISLTFRAIVLRFLLVNAATIALISFLVLVTRDDGGMPLVSWIFLVILPLLMIVHHVLRLWPWRYWLVIFELLASLIEVLVACHTFGSFASSGVKEAMGDKEIEDLPCYIMITTIASVVVISSVLAFLFLLWDTARRDRKDLMRPYDFSEGLCPPGRQWGLIFGRHNTRKQFSTDNRFIRCIRGGVAILCLLAISFLVYFDGFWNPISSTGRTAATILRVPVSDGSLNSTLQKLSCYPGQINAVLVVSNSSVPNQHPTIDLTYSLADMVVPPNCTSGRDSEVVFAACNLTAQSWKEGNKFEILVTIHFPEVPSDSRLYLGMTNSTANMLDNAEPIGLGPGSNIYGTSSIVIRKRLSNTKSALFGLQNYHSWAFINVRGQATDWLPSLPRNDNTATLRVTMLPQKEVEIDEEHAEVSVLDGFAKIGGIWTLTTGLFATVFGSTLLFELFGIKPLSVYGLVHLFRRGRASLADENGALSPEERDRIVGVLKEHLLDIDEEKVDPSTTQQYKPLDSPPPHVPHSPWAVDKLV